MWPATLSSILALSLAFPFGHHGPPRRSARVTQATYRVQGWRLHVTRDPFADTTGCELHEGDARVEQGRLIWALGAGVDSTHAVYRIDDGSARMQSSLSLPVSANLTNPSNGVIVAPVNELRGGRFLQVRANPQAHLRTLRIAGLDEALAAADRLGCERPANAPDKPPIS